MKIKHNSNFAEKLELFKIRVLMETKYVGIVYEVAEKIWDSDFDVANYFDNSFGAV